MHDEGNMNWVYSERLLWKRMRQSPSFVRLVAVTVVVIVVASQQNLLYALVLPRLSYSLVFGVMSCQHCVKSYLVVMICYNSWKRYIYINIFRKKNIIASVIRNSIKNKVKYYQDAKHIYKWTKNVWSKI